MTYLQRFFTIVAFFSHLCGSAQTVNNQVLDAGGGSRLSGNVLLESTVGEPLTGEGESKAYLRLTHGFLQPDGGSSAVVPQPIPLPVARMGVGIDNAGTSATTNNLFLEYTVGEWMTTARTSGNYLLTQGILQPGGSIAQIPLPVLALEFTAKRITAEQVQLDWKTVQEIANKGFTVERMKQNETAYGSLYFEPSKAAGGNSSVPLAYQYVDNNPYAQKTYYRIRQEDLDGKITYSTVQLVQGAKGKILKFTAYPNPAVKEFSVLVEKAPEKEERQTDRLLLFDINGRLVQQQSLVYNTPVKMTGLLPGVYLVRLESDTELVQRVVIQ